MAARISFVARSKQSAARSIRGASVEGQGLFLSAAGMWRGTFRRVAGNRVEAEGTLVSGYFEQQPDGTLVEPPVRLELGAYVCDAPIETPHRIDIRVR